MALEIIDLRARLPAHPTREYPSRQCAVVQRTVIHHSAVIPKGDSQAYIEGHIAAIARGHIRQGWPGIGYHFCIDSKGRIYQVNHLNVASYHVGRYNQTSVGVCLLGRFDVGHQEPTSAMLAAAQELTDWLKVPVVPHKALMKTRCPGDWVTWGW